MYADISALQSEMKREKGKGKGKTGKAIAKIEISHDINSLSSSDPNSSSPKAGGVHSSGLDAYSSLPSLVNLALFS